MSARYTQSKAETAKHAEILKAMLKSPDSKVCADCKRNDPRWASTNLGCFMCIRCSGIHRGMGVHITRIKSVDLDTWSPEQIALIQRWGNRRANAYWEAHLKPGHIPPEHKMESFIRSKYETKRWAMDGAVPDPETLDGPDATPTATAAAPAPAAASSSRTTSAAPSRKTATAFDLLGAPPSSSLRASASPPALSAPASPIPTPTPPAPTPAPSNGGGLFDLDFNAPAPTPTPVVKKDAKADILSLFAAAPPPRTFIPQQQQQPQHARQQSFGQAGLVGGLGGLSLGGGGVQQQAQRAVDPWGNPVVVPQQQQQRPQPPQQSSWGAFDGGFQSAAPAQTPGYQQQARPSSGFSTGPPAANVWGAAPAQAAAAASDPFGEFTSGSGAFGEKSGVKDSFSDIWS